MLALSPAALAERLRPYSHGLIGIDGYPGAGKSTVADELGALLGIPLVHLDDFLVPDQGQFVLALRYPLLSDALLQRPIIVEGVCLLAVMERTGRRLDVLVYVHGEKPHPRVDFAPDHFVEEVVEYHQSFRPADIADIVVKGVCRMDSSRADVDIAFINAKTKLALALVAGGMLTLIIGLAVLLYGVTGKDHTLLKAAAVEVSASGLGGVIMVTSVIWAFFAYKARPTYARVYQTSEEYDADSRLLKRDEHESSTMATVGRRR